MKAPAAILGWVDDRLNPIAVRELRQAVRSRFVAAVFLFFLGLEFLIVWLYLLADPSAAESPTGGQALTSVLYVILTLVCLILVPLYAGGRLAWERSSAQADLLFATSVSAGAIVRGKLLTAAILTGLIYSACAPFIVFTYLLRGVDLPTVFAMLGLGFLTSVGMSQFALLVACIPAGRVATAMLGAIGMLLILWWSGAAISLAVMMVTPGPFGGGWTSAADMWTALAGWTGGGAAFIGLLHVLSVAMLQPAAANRMLPVRLYVTALWLVGGGAAAAWAYLKGDDDPLEVWFVLSCIVLALAVLVAVSERETPGPRLRRRIPRSRLLRAPLFLLYSGAAGGLVWAIGLAAATFGTMVLMYGLPGNPFSPSGLLDPLAGVNGLGLYALAYGLTAVLLRRGLARLGVRIPHQFTWLIATALAAIGSVATILGLLLAIYSSGRWTHSMLEGSVWLFPNPFYLAVSDGREARMLVVLIWAGLALAVSVPWLVRQGRAFRPLPPASAPADGPVTHG